MLSNREAVRQDLKAFLQGGDTEKEELNEQLAYDQITYDKLGASEHNLCPCSITSYLTGHSACPATDGSNPMSLRIPNREGHGLYERMARDWFADWTEGKGKR